MTVTLCVYTGPQNETAYTIHSHHMIDIVQPEWRADEVVKQRVREVVQLLFGNPEVASVTVSSYGVCNVFEQHDNPGNAGKAELHASDWEAV